MQMLVYRSVNKLNNSVIFQAVTRSIFELVQAMTANDDDDVIKWSNFVITQLCIKGSFGGNLFEPHT